MGVEEAVRVGHRTPGTGRGDRADGAAARLRGGGLLCRCHLPSQRRRYHGLRIRMSKDPKTKSLRALAADLAERRITAQELLARSQAAHDPALNAYIHWAPDF